MEIVEFSKFILIAISVVGLFYALLRYLAGRTDQADNDMYQQLADELNGDYIHSDPHDLQTKTKTMFDFGVSALPLEKMVCSKLSGMDLFLFEHIDNTINTGHGDCFVPVWSVCLLEMPENLLGCDGLISYHKNITFGHLKRYKSFSADWQEAEYQKGSLKNYSVMIEGLKDPQDMGYQKILDVFEKYKPKYSGSIMPREVTLQIKGNYLALYSDTWAFSKAEQYLISLAFMKEIAHLLQPNKL